MKIAGGTARLDSRWINFVSALIGAVGATAVLAVMIGPFDVGPVGFDSAASVIHFERIVAGERLEAFVTATPKPLVTLLYGLIHSAFPDWRAISFATLGAFGAAVLVAVFIIRRAVPEAPRWVALVAAPLLLIGSPAIALDVSLAYAVPWALVGWLVAGWAAIGPRPRPWLVGIALLLATLARLETVAITGLVGVALAVQVVQSVRGRAASTWGVRALAITTVLASLALPVMLVHDLLLTGDPWFWLSVSAHYSKAATSVPTPAVVLTHVANMVAARLLPTLVGLIGLVALWRHQQRALVYGLVALGPGLISLLVVMAARGTYVSSRYYAGFEIALAMATALGVAAIAASFAQRSAAWGPVRVGQRRTLAAAVALILGGSVLGAPFAPRSSNVARTIAEQSALARLGDDAQPFVADLLGGRGLRGGQPAPSDARTWLYVPTLLRPRLAVDLDLPLWAVGGINASILSPTANLRSGAVIVHSTRFDPPPGDYAALETGGLVAIGGLSADTVASSDSELWVLVVR